jgi:hypothetical protein
MSQNKHFLFLSCLSQVFCHSDGKLSNAQKITVVMAELGFYWPLQCHTLSSITLWFFCPSHWHLFSGKFYFYLCLLRYLDLSSLFCFLESTEKILIAQEQYKSVLNSGPQALLLSPKTVFSQTIHEVEPHALYLLWKQEGPLRVGWVALSLFSI